MFPSRAMSRLSSEHDARWPNMRYQAKNELEPRCCWRALPLLALSGWADGRPSLGGRTRLWRPFAALRACCRRHGRPAALLLPGQVQSTCLQRLVAWSRHLQAAGLLECCAGTARRPRCDRSTLRSCGADERSKLDRPRPGPSPPHPSAGLGCPGPHGGARGGRSNDVP